MRTPLSLAALLALGPWLCALAGDPHAQHGQGQHGQQPGAELPAEEEGAVPEGDAAEPPWLHQAIKDFPQLQPIDEIYHRHGRLFARRPNRREEFRQVVEKLVSMYKNEGRIRDPRTPDREREILIRQNQAFEKSVNDVMIGRWLRSPPMKAVHDEMMADEMRPAMVLAGFEMPKGGYSGGDNSPPAWEYEAWLKLKYGDRQGALEDVNRALAMNPDHVPSLNTRSQIRYQMGNYGEAMTDAERALKNDPGNQAAVAMVKSIGERPSPSNLVQHGSGLQPPPPGSGGAGTGGRGGLDFAALERARRERAAAQQIDRAAGLFRVDRRKALDEVSAALALDPSNARGHAVRSMMHLRLRDYHSALSDAERALRLAKDNRVALNAKSRALNMMKRYAEAKAAALDALGSNMKDAEAWFNLAHAEYGLGNRAAALAALEKAAEYDPKRFGGRWDLASKLPRDTDLTLLFEEEDPEALKALEALLSESRGGARGRLVVVGAASAVGGVLIALGLWCLFSDGFRRKVSTAWRRRTARPETAPEGAAANGRRDVVGGAYQILRQIGAGGMGTVYEALDLQLERPVAIKKMRDEIRVDPRERERFLAEARTVAKMRHPSIVEIFSIEDEGDEIYLVFEFVEGETLDAMIARRGRLALDEARPVFKGVCAALAYAHERGVIHRDLKPSNIMLDREGAPKVMDFGVARTAKDALSRLSMTNTVVGTPPYMAPEAEQGMVRKESDIYSLGVCLYETLTGQIPFSGTGAGMLLNKMNVAYRPASELARGLPPAVDDLIASCLQPDPDKRIKTPSEVSRTLSLLSDDAGLKLRPFS